LELYVILDEGLLGFDHVHDALERAGAGGADAVQFRAKGLSKRQYYECAVMLLPVARHLGIPFFVNDHLDVALAISADGIHIGQDDLPCIAARHLVPREMLLGISTHSVEQAARAIEEGADYIAIGPVFATTTKENAQAAKGTEMVRKVKRRIGVVPLIAIGGINLDNVTEVIRCGADGVAIASGIVLADDPQMAAQELKARIRSARAERSEPSD